MALLVENLTSMLEGLSLIPAPHKPGMFMCCNPGMQQVEAGRLEGHGGREVGRSLSSIPV